MVLTISSSGRERILQPAPASDLRRHDIPLGRGRQKRRVNVVKRHRLERQLHESSVDGRAFGHDERRQRQRRRHRA